MGRRGADLTLSRHNFRAKLSEVAVDLEELLVR